MSYRSKVPAAVLCTMALAVTCAAQTYTDFRIASGADNSVANSGWIPDNIYAVDVNNDGVPDLIQDSARTGPVNGNGTFGVNIANGDGSFKPAVAYNYPPKMLGEVPMAMRSLTSALLPLSPDRIRELSMRRMWTIACNGTTSTLLLARPAAARPRRKE